ncbi:MAG TPA: Hpt domain-containing protein [Gemmatimonadaceae bacterium]|nr:Hpt domain-containing protein [Gemmatimonadaceae bacterium]
MTGAPGILDFFILEASEYVEQLDALLLGASTAGPDAAAMQRQARALRGAATMAKMPSFADLAASVERVGRGLQDSSVHWDPALGGALVAAIDDFRTLLRSVRTWSGADDDRANARTEELSRFAPRRVVSTPRQPSAYGAMTPPPTFLATEASNIAAGLELLTTRSGDAETAANVLNRVRALRGVAGVKEVAPLAEVLEATEDAARGLESRSEQMSPEARQLLETAATYLRTLASALRGASDVDAASPERDAFFAAQDTWANHAGDRERVVPIAELFYGDGGPGVVEPSQNPPTSASERFRLELVSLGEHLRQVVDGARRVSDAASVNRARRDLRGALRALQAAAASFGERDVAEFVASHAATVDDLDFHALTTLDDLASLLADPGVGGERLRTRLREAASAPDLTTSVGAGVSEESGIQLTGRLTPVPSVRQAPSAPLIPPTPAPLATPTPPSMAAHATNGSAAALIDSSIAALDTLAANPFGKPVPIPEDTVVPIESLLYRGRAALDRAVEIRDEIRRGAPRVDPIALEELFDLLELAQAE